MTDEQQPTSSWRERFFGTRNDTDGSGDRSGGEQPGGEGSVDGVQTGAAHDPVSDSGGAGGQTVDGQDADDRGGAAAGAEWSRESSTASEQTPSPSWSAEQGSGEPSRTDSLGAEFTAGESPSTESWRKEPSDAEPSTSDAWDREFDAETTSAPEEGAEVLAPEPSAAPESSAEPELSAEPEPAAEPEPTTGSIEPTVIAPSSLRGPSHSASHPDDAAPGTGSSGFGVAAGDDAPAVTESAPDSPPPALVEPQRPSFGLRPSSAPEPEAGVAPATTDGENAGSSDAATGSEVRDAEAAVPETTEQQPSAEGLAADEVPTTSEASSSPEFAEPETVSADAASGDRADEALGDQPTTPQESRSDDEATQAYDASAIAREGEYAETRALDTQSQQETQRFGLTEEPVPPVGAVGDGLAGAAAGAAGATAGSAPFVLIEEPQPPRRKGARGVGFAVALLATVIFAALLAGANFAADYLFNRDFNAQELLQNLWLQPAYLLPVIVFFLGYWILTLLVNRAGWWAHVLGGFIVALVTYAAQVAGQAMTDREGWASALDLPNVQGGELGQLLLSPLAVLTFVIAREVPIWVGGIVARRGRKAREYNKQAMDDFTAENARRLEGYEAASQ